MDTNVMFVDLYPGISEKILNHILHTPDIKGIVFKTYGAGNAPTDKWFTDAVHDAVERGIVILNVTQCVNGGIHSTRYVTGDCLARAGVVSGHDITSEAAITKMMYLFGMGLPAENVKKYLSYSLCGEVTI
jgi:L-asparaginase